MLFTALPVCGTKLRLAWEESTTGVNQNHHICDYPHDMDNSITDTSLQYSSIHWAFEASEGSGYTLSKFCINSWSWWCRYSPGCYLQCICLLFYKDYSIVKEDTWAERKLRRLSWHNCVIDIFSLFLSFELCCPFCFQVTENSNNNIFLKVKGLTMQTEIPPVFEQPTRASTNFWQKPFQVADFPTPKSTCLMEMFIFK